MSNLFEERHHKLSTLKLIAKTLKVNLKKNTAKGDLNVANWEHLEHHIYTMTQQNSKIRIKIKIMNSNEKLESSLTKRSFFVLGELSLMYKSTAASIGLVTVESKFSYILMPHSTSLRL